MCVRQNYELHAGTRRNCAAACGADAADADRQGRGTPGTFSAHVHIIPDNSVPLVPNIGYVVGDRAVLVIDTGLGPRNGAAVYAGGEELSLTEALFLVTTHVSTTLPRRPGLSGHDLRIAG